MTKIKTTILWNGCIHIETIKYGKSDIRLLCRFCGKSLTAWESKIRGIHKPCEGMENANKQKWIHTNVFFPYSKTVS